MRQFNHGWESFTLWDVIMPLFIFMCGAAMPLALERRLKKGGGAFWRHVLWRVVVLWALGVVLFFGRMALAAYFISHFFAPVLRSAAHLFGDGIVSHLPSSASPFALAFFEVASIVASMVIWRKAKAGNAELRRFGE